MPRRVLFVIRGKLGDSLVLAMAVRRYAAHFPEDAVTLAMRADYARLLEGERGIRLLPFGSRLEMLARLAWLRVTGEEFDVLAVLWGFGPPIGWIGRLVRAKRKIHFNASFPGVFAEHAELPRAHTLIAPALAVIEKFAPGMPAPDRLELPQLAARRERGARDAIGLVPVADELRKNWDPAALSAMIGLVRERHPGRAVRVFVNPANAGADSILGLKFREGVELKTFSALPELVEEYARLEAWYGTDTGLYHLAAAMGIPATVVFGPTQPWKIVMPAQPDATWVRLRVLGEEHCEVTACARPLCLEQAVASYCGRASATSLADTPPACPLRAHSRAALDAITVHENPRRQAR